MFLPSVDIGEDVELGLKGQIVLKEAKGRAVVMGSPGR